MKGHKAFKRRGYLVICLFVLIAALGTKGWMETTMDNQQANDTIFEKMDTQQVSQKNGGRQLRPLRLIFTPQRMEHSTK
ncbi:MAG: hypothetical protein OXFUSZZB_000079 [Candidatus Fervidibacter sp.]